MLAHHFRLNQKNFNLCFFLWKILKFFWIGNCLFAQLIFSSSDLRICNMLRKKKILFIFFCIILRDYIFLYRELFCQKFKLKLFWISSFQTKNYQWFVKITQNILNNYKENYVFDNFNICSTWQKNCAQIFSLF